MVKRNGGYAIVTHDDANIYNEVKMAYENHKPILFYDDDNTCYFIDTIKYGEDNDLIMTKGGKTFTITTNNTLSSEGNVANPTLENIKDLNGNLRFVEGEGTFGEISGVSVLYNKWSLSGTHLMIVAVLSATNATEINPNTILSYDLPKYIADKLVPSFRNNAVDIKQCLWLTDDDFTSQSQSFEIQKVNDVLYLHSSSSITMTDDRIIRIQFDLIIDNE